MATTTPVHIYLPIRPTSDNNHTEWICALTIPRDAIQRLTLRPLKWLRFATFAVCGAKGYLAATEGGEMVDHENVSLDNLADKYYYVPESNEYHLVDCQVFDDRESLSTNISQINLTFRRDICRRDSLCVVTRCEAPACDAAHIIPMKKGSNYITSVVHDRASLYEQLPFSPEEDININCIQNGILLRKGLHAKFVTAQISFLKTPNFAMAPTDVPRVEPGSIPNSRITLQYIDPNPEERYPVPQCDFLVDWSHEETSSPHSILLDFMYGAAIVKHWMNEGLRSMLQERFQHDFNTILAEDLKCSTPNDDWEPQQKGKKKARKTHSPTSKGLLEAMDDVVLLSMLLKGITPQMIAEERARREKEKELRYRERSCEKVEQWLN